MPVSFHNVFVVSFKQVDRSKTGPFGRAHAAGKAPGPGQYLSQDYGRQPATPCHAPSSFGFASRDAIATVISITLIRMSTCILLCYAFLGVCVVVVWQDVRITIEFVRQHLTDTGLLVQVILSQFAFITWSIFYYCSCLHSILPFLWTLCYVCVETSGSPHEDGS